ncbi:MAG: outer membrane beta-barrel protein [Bacteroidota bacterium]
MSKYLKIGTLIFSIFIFSKNAQAQTFKAGLLAGFNLSQLHGDDLAGFNQIGFNAGGRVAVTPNERWMWTLDLTFSQKGSNKSTNDPLSAPFENFRLNYTEVPLMVHYLDWLDEDGDTPFYKLHFHGGFAWGRLLDFTVRDIDGIDVSDSQDFNRNMFDLIAGATFWINPKIGVNGQYAFTVNNVRNDSNEQSLAGRTLTFRGIYMF